MGYILPFHLKVNSIAQGAIYNLEGKSIWKKDICVYIYITKSLYCTPKTNTAL